MSQRKKSLVERQAENEKYIVLMSKDISRIFRRSTCTQFRDDMLNVLNIESPLQFERMLDMHLRQCAKEKKLIPPDADYISKHLANIAVSQCPASQPPMDNRFCERFTTDVQASVMSAEETYRANNDDWQHLPFLREPDLTAISQENDANAVCSDGERPNVSVQKESSLRLSPLTVHRMFGFSPGSDHETISHCDAGSFENNAEVNFVNSGSASKKFVSPGLCNFTGSASSALLFTPSPSPSAWRPPAKVLKSLNKSESSMTHRHMSSQATISPLVSERETYAVACQGTASLVTPVNASAIPYNPVLDFSTDAD